MVFDDDVDVEVFGEGGEFVEAVGYELCGFFGFLGTKGVYANGVAVESFGCFDPLLVVVDGFFLLCFFGVTEAALDL